MKKKLALLLSAVMIATMVPMSAFAATDNRTNSVVTGKADSEYYTGSPILVMESKDLKTSSTGFTIGLSLTNGEWLENQPGTNTAITEDEFINDDTFLSDGASPTAGTVTATFDRITDTYAEVTVPAFSADNANKLIVNLFTVLKGEGDATVTVDGTGTPVSSGTYKFANVAAGATITTIEKTTDIREEGTKISALFIKEAAAGSLKGGETIRVKLTNGFEFKNTVVASDINAGVFDTVTGITASAGANEFSFTLASGSSTTPERIIINNLVVGFDEDDVEAGDIAEITVSGAGTTKQTVEVATARDYGISIAAENKTLPVFVAGRSDDTDSLKVTFKETIPASWLYNRKTEISFPEGVKVTDVKITGEKGVVLDKTEANIVDKKTDTSVVSIKPTTDPTSSTKVEAKFQFNLSIDPAFTGDITATFGGAGLGEDVSVVIGTAVAPITVEAETNEVRIDYRNVAIGDILIKETDAGYLKKGTTLFLEIEEMNFDGTPSVEVVEGDLKIDKVKVDGGTLKITIKSASGKTPSVLKVTGNELFLSRSIPAGKYALSLVEAEKGIASGASVSAGDNAIFQNYADPSKNTDDFETDEIVVLDDFIDVVTAGRDRDDSTFTTTISVAIGADKLVAGKTEIALDVPAYISEGYTMLPVRAVTEALSGAAIVRWDDATKTATITFGSRVVSMTVGSKTMNINGVAVQMSKACEITDSRAFIPLRDLGYALGLNDSKINWDDATKTATLN